MIQQNLLSSKAKETIMSKQCERIEKRKYRLITLACVALLIIVGGIFTGLHFSNRDLSEQVNEKLNVIENDNETGELDRLLTIQRQLSELDRLHDEKPVFSRLLDLLYKMSAGVDLQSIRLKNSNDNVMVIVGSVRDFTTFNSYKESLQNVTVSYDDQVIKAFESVEVGEASSVSVDGKVNFRIEAKYNSVILESGMAEYSIMTEKAGS